MPQALHSSFKRTFEELHRSGLFLHDVVQPGGKRLTLTSVSRTLIGEPGSTYKYLGLRLFSHPWCMPRDEGVKLISDVGYNPECAAALARLGEINRSLIMRTKSILDEKVVPKISGGLVGSAKFNLTLVNRMEPTTIKQDLKAEKFFGMGKTSVSWHKDSGLQDFSSIAVYHTIEECARKKKQGEKLMPWRVALRVAEKDIRTPALSIPLPSGSLYYLCDDFNHKHEHAVLSGSEQIRFSSTHRVARDGQGTWNYISDKYDATVSAPSIIRNMVNIDQSKIKLKQQQLLKEVRASQKLLTEIEFEWLRQWYIQGQKHAELHPFWQKPVEKLVSAFETLEEHSVLTVKLCKESTLNFLPLVTEDLFDVMIEALEDRMCLRVAWRERLRDPIFQLIPTCQRPFGCAVLDRETFDDSCQMPENLDRLSADLRRLRVKFLSRSEKIVIGGIAKGKKRKVSHMTKKEQMKVSSNWESMKLQMRKK